MKFGKQIQAQQIPGWASAYLDYKGLKKIINSLAKGRPADAALLAAGVSPQIIASTTQTRNSQPQLLSENGSEDEVPERNLKLHKVAFFFKLERELEKINAFYLQKEADLKVRMRTLIDKRKVIQLSSTRKFTKDNSSFMTLYEGFRHFEKDLRKLQTFIELNQTGFRKILKKWDKRSKSTTKELYLSRQVEVQPVFNRECIGELNDVAAASILELEELLLDCDDRQFRSHAIDPDADRLAKRWKDAVDQSSSDQPQILDGVEMDIIEFEEFEMNLIQAVEAGNSQQVLELLNSLPVPSSPQNQTDFVRSRLGRILWKAALSAEGTQSKLAASTKKPQSQSATNRIPILTPSTAMIEPEMIPSTRLDFSFVDDISGRTCLHEAATAGRTNLIRQSIQHKVPVSTADVYGRQPLHYAAMNGFSDSCRLLLSYDADPYSVDHDGYTPIIYAVQNGHVGCVQILLDSGVSLEPSRHAGIIPLSLVCQYGHLDIALLMLQRGAKIVVNQEGMWPQHLAARGGHEALLRLLVDSGANVDQQDSFSQWTPLFHAASEGHEACVEVLIAANSDCHCLDETRKPPIHYAAWRGHIRCVNLLLAQCSRFDKSTQGSNANFSGPVNRSTSSNGLNRLASYDGARSSGSLMTGSSTGLDAAEADVDMIPDLSLPPPIIPFRIYGHNYLDKKALVQLFLGHPNTARSARQPIQLYGQPELTSLKLVISNRSDLSSVVHSTILPLEYERESFAFHTDRVDQLTLEFELFPTFGTKIMGKAVGLPSNFEASCNQKPYILPLMDKHLKVIGEVAFELNVVRPFPGVQLSFGGRVETYWKAMTNMHLNTTTTSESPQISPFGTPSMGNGTNAFVTASSLSGQYIQVTVQLTRDKVPVVYSKKTLKIQGFEIPVHEVTIDQFLKLSQQTFMIASKENLDAIGWYQYFERSLLTLENVLKELPSCYGLELEIGDPWFGRLGHFEINELVDSILKTIYGSTSYSTRCDKQINSRLMRRRLVLSSSDPLVCTALNWKQPNYAVFFTSHCGVSGWNRNDGQLIVFPASDIEVDRRCSSILEAAKFAKANNLLGVRLNATLVLRVPSLIQSAKENGLFVATFGEESNETVELGVDGYMSSEGVLEYSSSQHPELADVP
ncbi:hypothetical protein PPACK8108_LOCUS4678 [Phakopsora pachyrhizi]|uniref:Cyclin-dependent protein kinase inhibitor n=1 Tax=Phakopsora pachyrhizi TaxID=170000 RepID=A0AAV0AME2_PHAPC|nr:hypothetical protein PPACK8108_LOCUS4678 [Phakopsora pachyrhizi]